MKITRVGVDLAKKVFQVHGKPTGQCSILDREILNDCFHR